MRVERHDGRAGAERMRTEIVTLLMEAGSMTATELLDKLPRHGKRLVYEHVYRSLRVLETRNTITRAHSSSGGRHIRWQLASKTTRTAP